MPGARVWLNGGWLAYDEYLRLELALSAFPADLQGAIRGAYRIAERSGGSSAADRRGGGSPRSCPARDGV